MVKCANIKILHNTGYQPAHCYLEEKIRTFPSLCDPNYKVDMERDWADLKAYTPVALPCTFKHYRILYTIVEYEPLLDSSNIFMEDWATMAKHISTHYHHFNGFVILHGTDTMSYTASALSFMFENLGKTVILTGSQVCLYWLPLGTVLPYCLLHRSQFLS